jgi:hypothetical protein
MANAMKLLAFATENRKPVDDQVRKSLVEAADALQQDALTPEIEESFLKAYQELLQSKAMEGVTAETLEASRTRLPRLGQLLSRDFKGFCYDLRHVTGGRLLHCLAFLGVLLSAGYVLGQYTIGEMALEHYQTSTRCLDDATSAAASVEDAVTAPNGKASLACRPAQVLVAQYTTEQAAAKDALQRWMELPCNCCLTKWALCLLPGQQREEGATIEPQALQLMAEIRQKRTGEIQIPFLLGLLGAYSYVLRSMSLEIKSRTFAPGSLVHNVVRLSLGAMAGLIVGWLVDPDSINVAGSKLSPYMGAWVLAFVAGYSIELVFTLLDKIVSAFTSKPT